MEGKEEEEDFGRSGHWPEPLKEHSSMLAEPAWPARAS
jgi:hypothetical protein